MNHMSDIKERANFYEDPQPGSAAFVRYTLLHSKLPTLVVEGITDEVIYKRSRRMIYRELEAQSDVEILIANGRDNLLEVYENKKDFENQVAVAFMADQDMYVFGRIPKCYSDIIWTSGYSIENDLYSDGRPEKLIPSRNTSQYSSELEKAIQEFARSVALWKAKGCSTTADTLEESCQKEIKTNPALKLRGKTLFELLLDVCQDRNHLELSMSVFSTIDWDSPHPPRLSILVKSIQTEISKKQKAIHGGPSLLNKISKSQRSKSP